MKTLIMHDMNNEDFYIGEDGTILRRETGKITNDIEVYKNWVLRDKEGNYIDNDQYRYDLAERNEINLIHDCEV